MKPTLPELTPHQRDLMLMGMCPFCEERIKNWKPVFGSFAPEWWATIREVGRDPNTGHKLNCKYKNIRLS